MEFKKPRKTRGTQEETKHALSLRRVMQKAGWYTIKIHGNIYQKGLPDIYAAHKQYGQRWIETKSPSGGKLTTDQIRVFTELSHFGVGVWILRTREDIPLLFRPPNWKEYLQWGDECFKKPLT